MRHAWDKIATHRYRCRLCGLDKEHVQQPAEHPAGPPRWVAVFLRDGAPVAHGRTPDCPGPPPAADPPPVALTWRRVDRWHEVADSGHTVCAQGGADGWRFSAFGPDQAPGLTDFRQWPPDAKVRYAIGERVPQRFPLLGCFATAEAARDACANDARMMQ